jgi:hypothetical protein
MHTALFVLLVQIAFAGAVSAIGKISQAVAILLWIVGEVLLCVFVGILIVGELYQSLNGWGAVLVLTMMIVTCMLGTVVVGGDILGDSALAALHSFATTCLDFVTGFASKAYAGLAVCGVCVAIIVYMSR